MTDTFDARTFQAQLERLDRLIQDVEHFADPAARALTREMVRSLLDLHGIGISRVLQQLEKAGEAGRRMIESCAGDGVISGLLLLHGLHPLDLEARVRQALDGVRPYLRSHGGDVELLSVADGVVRLRLSGSCHSCPSSGVTIEQTIEEAIYGRAPEVTLVRIETSDYPLPMPDGNRLRIDLPVI